MILDFIDTKHDRGPAIVAGLLVLIVAGASLARCSTPRPPVMPPSIMQPTIKPAEGVGSKASAGAATSQTVKIRLPIAQTKAESGSQGSASQEPRKGPLNSAPVRLDPPKQADPGVIEIEITQTATAGAWAEGRAEVSAPIAATPIPHARLGAIVSTAPGVLALDYQIASLPIPEWVIGAPLEVGLDVTGNLSHVGLGLGVGGKLFAIGGGYLSTSGPGWLLGVGARF